MWGDVSRSNLSWHAGEPRGINRPCAGDHRHEGAPSATEMTPVADAAARQPVEDWMGHASISTTMVSAPRTRRRREAEARKVCVSMGEGHVIIARLEVG